MTVLWVSLAVAAVVVCVRAWLWHRRTDREIAAAHAEYVQARDEADATLTRLIEKNKERRHGRRFDA